MRKKLVLAISIMLIGVFFNQCVKKASENKNPVDNNIKKNEEVPSKTTKDNIEIAIENMTLDEKIGQLIIVGINGVTMDVEADRMIREKKVGGVILFGDNVKSLEQVINLTNELKSINNTNDIPLFISVDEEGGLVSRLPDNFKRLPSASYIGSLENEELAYGVGNVIAKQLKIQGYNMDYAPVLDILSNPTNTVIGTRAFGNSADIVSRLAIKTMEGLKDNNIISVVKHFPGHGDTSVDSHYGLPLVTKTLDELKDLELIPFENAIKNGADAIMVSHILLERVDKNNPASMSSIVINNILREEMNFGGVVVTDDMTMGAIIENYDIGEASIKAINAGCDIILVCHGYDNEIKVINSIKEAVDNGIITEERINESVYRVLSLKEKYNLSDAKTEITGDVLEINNQVEKLFK